MILDVLTRWFLRVERRPPPPGFSVEGNLGDVDFDMDGDRWRRSPADEWLRQ